MVAGFGSGKTEALADRALKFKLLYPSLKHGFYEPTIDLLKLIAYPRFEEKLSEAGIPYKLNKSDKQLHIQSFGTIIFRSLENPERIIGYEHADAEVDEIDTLKSEKAEDCWRRILSRNRAKKPDGQLNTVGLGTTPEGFRFTYDYWVKNPRAGYELIPASTYSNLHNLPPDYIESLMAIYPEALIKAYIRGEFTNMISGSIYSDFCRDANGTKEKIAKAEHLHIGMDFNVYHMAATIGVVRDGRPMILEEITDGKDTPAVLETIKARYPDNPVTIYPDASGNSKSSKGATLSDYTLIRGAGFKISAPPANPPVKDRVMAVNAQIHNGSGERKLLVNVDNCPSLTATLEQQVYDKNGQPDKTEGLDHHADALGYFIYRKWPIKRKGFTSKRVAGM